MPSVDNQGVEIAFDDVGAGRCVVLAHSFLCSGAMWAPQVPVLSESHRVLNVDLRGHGRSGHVASPFDLRDMVSDIVAVLDRAGVSQAVWAGLSIGGMIALRAALTVPSRVSGLILVGTHAGAEAILNRLRYRAMGLGVRLLGIRPFVPTVTQMMFGPTTRRDKPALVSEWKDRFAAAHVPSVLHGLDTLVRRDSVVGRLGEIRVPTLVIVGEDDQSLPPVYSREIHAGVAGSRLVIVPRAGHLTSLEQPERVNEEMAGFLKSAAR